ncbi:MAG: hypothetical protein OXD36_13910 [Rhodobacter sp.]|nr:hypothetical protein [Rhodobacter sp.]
MRISKLLMPAVTVAGALALAGCGGGSSTPGTGDGDRRGSATFTNNTACSDGTTVTGTGSTAAAAAADAAAKCPPDPTPDPDLPEGVTASTLLDQGEFRAEVTVNALRDPAARTRASAVAYDHSNSGKFWDEILTVVEKDIEGLGLKDLVVSASGYKVPGETPFPQNNGPITGTGVNYRGIVGTFTCADGEDCTENGRTLGTGWYFEPTDAAKLLRYKPASNSPGTYEPSDASGAFAEWGYWVVTAQKESTVHRLARAVNNSSSLALNEHPVASNNKATYSGKAHGISVMGDNAGDFTANASLTATFKGDTNTEVEGMISGFEGHAVNTGWELKLEKDTLDTGIAGNTSGGSNVKEGAWTGTLYGADSNRPTGIVGNFDGYFTDGQVTGVYHADNK